MSPRVSLRKVAVGYIFIKGMGHLYIFSEVTVQGSCLFVTFSWRVTGVLYIFCIEVLCQIYTCILSRLARRFIFSTVTFEEHKFLILVKSNLLNFWIHAFCGVLKKSS